MHTAFLPFPTMFYLPKLTDKTAAVAFFLLSPRIIIIFFPLLLLLRAQRDLFSVKQAMLL